MHNNAIVYNLKTNMVVANDMIPVCNDRMHAKRLEKQVRRDLVSLNTIITSYSQNRHGKQVLEIFVQMLTNGVEPDIVTVVSILPARVKLEAFN